MFVATVLLATRSSLLVGKERSVEMIEKTWIPLTNYILHWYQILLNYQYKLHDSLKQRISIT